jgi:predicted  nucleic acid-binding Zn-ribbon protein
VEPLRSKVSAIQKDLSAALGERDALQDALGSSRDRVVSLEKKLEDAVKRGEDAKRAREESVRAAFEGDARFRAVLQAAVSWRFFPMIPPRAS